MRPLFFYKYRLFYPDLALQILLLLKFLYFCFTYGIS